MGTTPEWGQGKSISVPPGLLHTVTYRIIGQLGDQEAWPISVLPGNQFVFMIRILCKTLKQNELQHKQ